MADRMGKLTQWNQRVAKRCFSSRVFINRYFAGGAYMVIVRAFVTVIVS
jgi:hypothetical protein